MLQLKTMSKSVKIVMITAAILTVIIVIVIANTRTYTPIDYAIGPYHEITLPIDHFNTMPPDPYPVLDDHRPVFFMKPNSTAQIYVKYFATWDYPDMIYIAKGLSVHNGTNYQSLSNPPFSVYVDPDLIPHKNGENYTVVYTFTAKPDARGIYGMPFFGCYNRGGDLDIAVGLNSSQISPQDIPVIVSGMAACKLSGFIEYQIVGFVNTTVEYKFAIRAP